MELADENMGAEVYSASCYDIRHEPRCILDPAQSTFWTTTGTFPQEYVVRLPPSEIYGVTVLATNVRSISLEYSTDTLPDNWKPVDVRDAEMYEEVEGEDGALQEIRWMEFPRSSIHFVRCIIRRGWQDFVTIHNVHINGQRA